MQVKKCSRCGLVKPTFEFNHRGIHNYRSECKICQSITRYAANQIKGYKTFLGKKRYLTPDTILRETIIYEPYKLVTTLPRTQITENSMQIAKLAVDNARNCQFQTVDIVTPETAVELDPYSFIDALDKPLEDIITYISSKMDFRVSLVLSYIVKNQMGKEFPLTIETPSRIIE